MLLQCSADGNTIDGGLGGAAQKGLVGDSSSGTFLLSVTMDGSVELSALGRCNGLACLPDLFGGRFSVLPGTAQAVPDHASLVKVSAGPAAGMRSQRGLVIGNLFVTAAGGLARADVLRGPRGTTKVQYTPCGKQATSLSGSPAREKSTNGKK